MEDILSELPETEVVGDVGRNQSFEVSINGQLVFSKLKTYGFPKAQDIIRGIQRAAQWETCQEIVDSKSGVRAAQGEKCQEIVDAKSEIIKEIQRASQGEKCQEITDSESPWCVLL
ncbi:MIEN1-like protein [Mya arenaria]|uniref:MIEN1-like protein n=1 Tax=Mya arenaria TaxID=6604 RepID=A0ABY7G5Z4_MYAAR|nr:MIEN1-like protein [Mya arenaria]